MYCCNSKLRYIYSIYLLFLRGFGTDFDRKNEFPSKQKSLPFQQVIIFSFKELVEKREKLFTSFLPSSSFKGVTRRVKTDLNALIALKNS